MISVLRKLLASRAIAAALNLASSTLGVVLLSGSEYALASVAIAYCAVAISFFYHPFAKYVLVAGETSTVGDAFWFAQVPVIFVLTAIAVVVWFVWGHISPELLASAIVFTVGQGWKDFCGEQLRVRSRITEVQRLYVGDAVTTFILTLVALSVHPSGGTMLLASAVSSMCWARHLNLSRTPRSRVDATQILEIYRYAAGPAGANVVNSSQLAIARTAILNASPPELKAAIQFMLDMLQKPLALLASTTNSVAVPETQNRHLSSVVRFVSSTMTIALFATFALAIAISWVGPRFGVLDGAIPVAALASCSFFIWSNRYKTSVMDLPLVATTAKAPWILVGSGLSLAATVVCVRQPASLEGTMMLCAFAIFLGGMSSVAIAISNRLIRWSDLGHLLAIPLVFFAAISAWIW